MFWELVRDRRFQGLKFRRQHAVGRFVLDFYCHELRLAVEIDGRVHDDPEQAAADRQRQTEIEESGARFYRIAADQVESDRVAALDALALHILSLPSPATNGSRERGQG